MPEIHRARGGGPVSECLQIVGGLMTFRCGLLNVLVQDDRHNGDAPLNQRFDVCEQRAEGAQSIGGDQYRG